MRVRHIRPLRCYIRQVLCFLFGHLDKKIKWQLDDQVLDYEQVMCDRCWRIEEVVR